MPGSVSNITFQIFGFQSSLVDVDVDEYNRLAVIASDIQRNYLWVLASVGIPANILAVIGVCALGTITPPGLLVLLLSVTDAITLFLKLVFNQISVHEAYIGLWGCRFEFIVLAFGTLANWILLGISADRFLVIRRAREVLRRKKTSDVTASLSGGKNGGEAKVTLDVGGKEGGGNTTTQHPTETKEDDGSKNKSSVGSNASKWERYRDRSKKLAHSMYTRDEHGDLFPTNAGVFAAVVVLASLLMAFYAAIFFEMRGATHSGRSCGTLTRYSWFWTNVWLWINTAMFFFLPFIGILILTTVTVIWLLIDRREARRCRGAGGQSQEQALIKDETTSASEKEAKDESGEKIVNSSKVEKGTENANADEEGTQDNSVVKASTRSEQKTGKTLTAMMVLAATLFLFLALPGCIYFLSYTPTDDPVASMRWKVAEQIQFVLVDSTHAVNFFIYFLAVKDFRDALLRALLCRR